MEKISIEISDTSAETLLSSTDSLSDDSYSLIARKERDEWKRADRRKTQLIVALVVTICIITITTIIQSLLLWRNIRSDDQVEKPDSFPQTHVSRPPVGAADREGDHDDGDHKSIGQYALNPQDPPAGEDALYYVRYPCGTRPPEAMARGCVFDYMQFAWQPPECYYPDLDRNHTAIMQAAFAAAGEGQLRWWADADLTELLPNDPEILKHYAHVWVDRRYHFRHCIYTWDLLHYAYDYELPVPAWLTREHSLHCADLLWHAMLDWDDKVLLIEHDTPRFSGCIWPGAEIEREEQR